MDDSENVEYAKRRLRRNYRGDPLTSGPLIVGAVYQIVYRGSDDFRNVGSVGNFKGEVFKATGTTPTTWNSGSVLYPIDVTTLRSDADIVFESAVDTVTLTDSAHEGGSQSGAITFPKAVLGQALEQLLEEFDPDYVPAPEQASGFVMRFSGL